MTKPQHTSLKRQLHEQTDTSYDSKGRRISWAEFHELTGLRADMAEKEKHEREGQPLSTTPTQT